MLSKSELAHVTQELNDFPNNQYGSYKPTILLITVSSFEKIGIELSRLAELDVFSLFIADEVNMIPEDGKSFWSELLQLKNKFIVKLKGMQRSLYAKLLAPTRPMRKSKRLSVSSL